MDIKRAFSRRSLLIIGAVFIALFLYCLEIVSTVVYSNYSLLALKTALDSSAADPLADPAVAPLVDNLRRDRGELAAQAIENLVELRANIEPQSIKEFLARMQSGKAKMTFGITDNLITKWKALAESIQKPLVEGESEEPKILAITTLKQEVNRAIISALIPRPPGSVVKQYELLNKIIPALPESQDLFSNKDVAAK